MEDYWSKCENEETSIEKSFFVFISFFRKSIIKNFKNIKKGDHLLVSNLKETLEAEVIKINNKGGHDDK